MKEIIKLNKEIHNAERSDNKETIILLEKERRNRLKVILSNNNHIIRNKLTRKIETQKRLNEV